MAAAAGPAAQTIDLDAMELTTRNPLVDGGRAPGVEVRVRGLGVTVSQLSKAAAASRNPFTRWRGHEPLQLLRGITATFAPGTATLVMAGHGGGKSTLLKVLAGRYRGRHEGEVSQFCERLSV